MQVQVSGAVLGEGPTADLAALAGLPAQPLVAGDLCPQCLWAQRPPSALDYDGLLNLTCAHCGFTLCGGFT